MRISMDISILIFAMNLRDKEEGKEIVKILIKHPKFNVNEKFVVFKFSIFLVGANN